MKRNLLIGITILGMGGALVFNVIQGNREEYVAGTATTTVEVIEEYPSDVLERAVKAQEDVLRRYDLEQEKTRLRAESDVLEVRMDEIDKELGVY